MSYQVLARKWRPQEFGSLIGQGPIVTALRNALNDGRLAQAYLFSGIRGVGKTTAARILAKALNCLEGPTAEPCNECVVCREITQGADLDVLEVDAATYSKVEQIRDLTDSLRYGPARDRYKVVVIDEIHRLSRQAFDALLKIVEEPPPHVVFIFATTEIEAVPATLLSRCQEFHFRRVPAQEVTQYLRQLCEREGIEASDTALRLLSRAGEGSVRDSVALLDQLATFGGGRVDDGDVARLLGGLDTALFQRLLRAILEGDAATITGLVQEIDNEGWDPRQAYTHFLSYCRDALHLALGGETRQMDLPAEEARDLAEMARTGGYENLLRLLHNLLASESLVRRSEAGTLAVEIAWLRAAELPKLTAIEGLLSGDTPWEGPGKAGSPEAGHSAPSPVPGPGAPTPTSGRIVSQAAEASGGPPVTPSPPRPGPSRSRARTKEPPEPSAPPLRGGPQDSLIRSLLEEISTRRQALAAHLEAARELLLEEDRLLIYAPPGDPWLARALERQVNRKTLEEALAHVMGRPMSWQLVEGRGGDGNLGAAGGFAAESGSNLGPAMENPTVQTVLDIFGGTVQMIERRKTATEESEDEHS